MARRRQDLGNDPKEARLLDAVANPREYSRRATVNVHGEPFGGMRQVAPDPLGRLIYVKRT
jgi:hypothetical protein